LLLLGSCSCCWVGSSAYLLSYVHIYSYILLDCLSFLFNFILFLYIPLAFWHKCCRHKHISGSILLPQLLACLRFVCADYFSHRKSPLLWVARARLRLIPAATPATPLTTPASETATTTTGAWLLGSCKSKRCEMAKSLLALNFRQSVFTRH